MPESKPCPDAARLQDLLAGVLSAQEQEEVSRHVEECGPCQGVLEQLTASSWEGRAGELRHEAAVAPAVERIVAAALGQPTAAEPNTAPKAPAAVGDFLRPSDRPGSLGRLDHYEIEEVIGQGGFGVVFRAFDTKLHRMVAIKALSPELAASATARKRFIREAQAAAVVKNDHVIAIHAVDQENTPPFLVMEYVEGLSLQEKLDAGGALELKEILRIGMQIAEGLAAAHKQGLVHRDIKPANILLENGVQRVKITDFGLARAVDDASVTQSGVIAGTPMYMAPEQAAGETVDHRADLFSLGSVIYTMCTGRPPFRASGTMAVLKRVMEEEPRPIREVNPETPLWLEDIVAKLHAKRPGERFQSATEVAELLGQHLAHLQQPDQTRRPAPVERPPTPKVRAALGKKLAKAAVMVALALAFTEWRGITNLHNFFLRFSDPIVALQIEEPPVLVRIFETNDEDERAPKFSIKLRGSAFSDFGPAASVNVDSNFKTVRMPPGRYWVMISKDSQLIHRRLINIERGDETLVRVGGSKRDPGLTSDASRLQGKWLFHKGEKNGQPIAAADAPPWIAFKADRLSVQTAGAAITEQVIAIDPNNKQIYLFGVGTGDVEGVGIYKIQDDTLTLCVAKPGSRPTEFVTTPGSWHELGVYKRETLAPNDHERFLGAWDVLELWDNGVKASKDEAATQVVITAETLKMFKDAKETDRYLYEIEPGRNPKRIRLANVHEGGPWQGIYELRGDALRICTNDKIGGKLPTAFESLPDSHNDVLFVLKRTAGGLTAPVTPTPP